VSRVVANPRSICKPNNKAIGLFKDYHLKKINPNYKPEDKLQNYELSMSELLSIRQDSGPIKK